METMTANKLLDIIADYEQSEQREEEFCIMISPKLFHELKSDNEAQKYLKVKDRDGFFHHEFRGIALLIDNKTDSYEIIKVP